MIDWNDFAREVHAVAVDKGWWDKPVSFDDVICDCLVHLAHAYEQYRNGRPNLYYPCNAGGVCEADKTDGAMDCGSRVINPDHPEIYCMAKSKTPSGVAVDLADCVLRLMDYAVDADIYIEEATPLHVEGISITSVVCTCGDNLMEARRCFTENDGELWKIPICFGLCIGVIMEWARQNNVDMESILREKHEYNKAQPYRHEGTVL